MKIGDIKTIDWKNQTLMMHVSIVAPNMFILNQVRRHHKVHTVPLSVAIMKSCDRK